MSSSEYAEESSNPFREESLDDDAPLEASFHHQDSEPTAPLQDLSSAYHDNSDRPEETETSAAPVEAIPERRRSVESEAPAKDAIEVSQDARARGVSAWFRLGWGTGGKLRWGSYSHSFIAIVLPHSRIFRNGRGGRAASCDAAQQLAVPRRPSSSSRVP